MMVTTHYVKEMEAVEKQGEKVLREFRKRLSNSTTEKLLHNSYDHTKLRDIPMKRYSRRYSRRTAEGTAEGQQKVHKQEW